MFKYIFHILLVSVLCVGLVACGNTDDMPVQQENGPVQVTMTLVVDRGVESRAVHTEGERVEGEGNENYINIERNDIRFYLFGDDRKFLSEIEVKSITPMDNERRLYMVRAMMKEKPTGAFKIMILANLEANGGAYPTVDPDEEVDMWYFMEASEFIYTDKFDLATNSRIPMYGVHTYTDVEFSANMEPFLDEITLLRAMAKVEVICKEDIGYELVSTKMINYSVRGMGAPKALFNRTEDVMVGTVPWGDAMHVDHDDRINTGTINFPASNILYVPEYLNTDEYLPTYLTVKLKNTSTSEEKEYQIEFRRYINGKPTGDRMDIWRNNYYQFVITGVGASVEVSCRVADWIHNPNKDDNESHYWEQDFEYPSHTEVLPWEYHTGDAITENQVKMYYTSEIWDNGNLKSYFKSEDKDIPGSFDVTFTITSPVGQQWSPIIMDAKESEFLFLVSRVDKGKGTYTTLPNEADWKVSETESNTFRIQVIPKNVLQGSGNMECDFCISTTINYLDKTELLLINPEPAKWPGNEAYGKRDCIRIKQTNPPS